MSVYHSHLVDELFDACDRAKLSKSFVSKMLLGKEPNAPYAWKNGSLPDRYVPIIKSFIAHINNAVDKGLLPKSRYDLMWLGLEKLLS